MTILYIAPEGQTGSLQQALTEAEAMVETLRDPATWAAFMADNLHAAVQGLLENPSSKEITVRLYILPGSKRLAVESFETPAEVPPC